MKLSLKECIGVALVGLLLLGWFVKYTVTSRFDVIPGNIGDARFLLYLCEHWYQVFTSRADWLSPGMFFPQTGTLGFSDSLFLFGTVYSLLREVVEQGNAHRDVFSKSVERAFMASVPPAPRACRAMVMMAQNDTHMGWWAPLQIDAMLIAQANYISTVNGYSGWTPDNWTLHMPTEPGYKARVREWVMGHNLDELCSFQYETRTWAPFDN